MTVDRIAELMRTAADDMLKIVKKFEDPDLRPGGDRAILPSDIILEVIQGTSNLLMTLVMAREEILKIEAEQLIRFKEVFGGEESPPNLDG